MRFSLIAWILSASLTTSISPHLGPVEMISYDRSHRGLLACLKTYCMQLIICIANSSWRMSSFDLTIILTRRHVLSPPNGEFLRILSSCSLEVSKKTFVRSRLLKKSTSSADGRLSALVCSVLMREAPTVNMYSAARDCLFGC